MNFNIQSIFKRNKKLICLFFLLCAFNIISFATISYSTAIFPSNDLYSLFSLGFKDAKESGENSIFGSVSFKNTGTNYSLNKAIPYDDCFILENTYSKESNMTFLVINGNQQTQPCIIESEDGSLNEYPVFAVCMDNYFDMDYIGTRLPFSYLNSILIPESLAREIGFAGGASNKKVKIFSKRNDEYTNKELTVCGVYRENEKAMFMKNIAGQFPVIISKNTTIPGTPSLYFRAQTDSYLYYNVYAKKLYDSIALDWYETNGKYATRVIEFYNDEFKGKKEALNEIVSTRANFIGNDSRFIYLTAALLSFALTNISSILILAQIAKRKLCSNKCFYFSSLLSTIFPFAVFSIVNTFTNEFPFGSHFQLLNGVGIITYILTNACVIIGFVVKAKKQK